MANTPKIGLKIPSTADNIAEQINIDTPNNLGIIDTEIDGVKTQINDLADKVIISSGSNANGSYVRFGDGTQICYQKFDGNLGENSVSAAWTFPAAFKSGSVVSCFCSGLNGREDDSIPAYYLIDKYRLGLNAGRTTLAILINATDVIPAQRYLETFVGAIGRWK